MGTPEGLRGLLDLVSADEARALQRVADIDEANALLERYATTAPTLAYDVTIAEKAMAAAREERDRMATHLDRVAGVRVQELVDATDRAEAAEAERERLLECRDIAAYLGLCAEREAFYAVVLAARRERAVRAAWLATLPGCAMAPADVTDAETATGAALDALTVPS